MIELSEVQKLTRGDYVEDGLAQLEALRAASERADAAWMLSRKERTETVAHIAL